MFIFSKSKKPTLLDKEMMREDRAEGVISVVRLMAVFLFIAVALLVSVVIIYPRVQRAEQMRELERAKQEYRDAREDERHARNHLFWMNDPEYFEQSVRDKANLALPEEKVIRSPELKETTPNRNTKSL